MLRHRLRHLLALLLLALIAAPNAAPPARAAQDAPPALDQAPVTLEPLSESEPNDTLAAIPAQSNANLIDPAQPTTTKDWTRRVSGAIGAADDVDYFRLTIVRPASKVTVDLSGLSADYDLVLAGGAGDLGEGGLEGIVDVGSQISSIGSQISSIGSQISSIGSQISSIGSQISSIGSQISSISANRGTAAERIETTIWLPGTYYVAVASAGGASGPAYTLDVTVAGSSLGAPPPTPEVEVRLPGRLPYAALDQITTLYVVNSLRMRQLYRLRSDGTDISTLMASLNSLAQSPPNPAGAAAGNAALDGHEYGYVIDIGNLVPLNGTTTISDVYNLWQGDPADATKTGSRDNPFYANMVAGLIDNLVEAVTLNDGTPGVSGPGAKFRLDYATTAPLAPAIFPNLKYVVLVGGDDTVPFFRLPDLTAIANESDYLAYTASLEQAVGGMIDPARPLGAALKNRMLLSDNPYGAARPYRFPGSPLFVPRLAVGRLVETPGDIAAYLARYAYLDSVTGGSGYVIQPVFNEGAEAFVSGYDFLKDQAEEVSKTIGLAGYQFQPDCGGGFPCTPGSVTALNSDAWTRTELENDWFNGQLDSTFSITQPNDPFGEQRTQLSSVNAHFDHWQLLPAKDTAGNFPAQRLYEPTYDGAQGAPGGYFGGTFGYSVGCHSGYSVYAAALNSAGATIPRFAQYRADFAQAFNRHGGNWVGNTGYGYGTLDGVDYSERLSVLLTQELFTRVTDPLSPTVYIGQSIGEALQGAKLRYLRNASSLSAYDAKALQVMTLYGLPYIRFVGFTDYLLDPPSEEGSPTQTPPAERPAPVPTPSASGLLERTIIFDIDLDLTVGQPDSDLQPVPRTGSQQLVLDPADFTVTDSFAGPAFPAQRVRVYQNNQVGVPELPRFAYDISALNQAGSRRLIVRDVQFVEGSYGALQGFDPAITQIVSETDDPLISTPTEPSFTAGAGIWYPDKFFGSSRVGEGEEARDQLVSAAAQFRADATGDTGLLRPYSRMVFRVTYVDPAAAQAAQTLADTTPPTIESVRLEPVIRIGQTRQTPSTRIVVQLGDGEAGATVQANYVQAGSTWKNLVFTQPDPSGNPGRYVAELPQLAGDVRAIVRATDAAGNTSYYTAKGSFAPPGPPTLYLPMLRR